MSQKIYISLAYLQTNKRTLITTQGGDKLLLLNTKTTQSKGKKKSKNTYTLPWSSVPCIVLFLLGIELETLSISPVNNTNYLMYLLTISHYLDIHLSFVFGGDATKTNVLQEVLAFSYFYVETRFFNRRKTGN